MRAFLALLSIICSLFVIACVPGDGAKSDSASRDANTTTIATEAETGQTAATPPPDSTAKRKQWDAPPAMTIDPARTYTATIETNKGTIVAELLPKESPNAVNNFVFLARQGFYRNVPVHRVVKGFVIQSGDPTGTGGGGPGYNIEDDPVTGSYTRGVLAMANTGAPNSGGSQFFITLADLNATLTKTYPIFGRVTKGMDVADKIAQTPVVDGGSGEQSKPTEPVTITNIAIAES